VRRIAFLGVVALLAVGLAGLALAARTRTPARAPAAQTRMPARARNAARIVPGRVAHAATPTVVASAGSTCYVSVPYCSETPCVQFVRGGGSAVYVLPGIVPARPAVSCQARARAKQARPPGVVVAVPAHGAALQGILPGLAHRLSSRGP
jgi:hypothetical protein